MIIQVSAGGLSGVRPLGSGEPDDDYYAVRIAAIEAVKDKPEAAALVLKFSTGFEKKVFLHSFDPNLIKNGTEDEKKKHRGRAAALRSVLEALGYTAEQIDTGAPNDAWLVYNEQTNPRQAHVGWCSGEKGVKDSYGDVVEWCNPADFAAKKARGEKPSRGGLSRGQQPSTGMAPAGGPPAFTPPSAPPAGGGFSPPPAPPGGGFSPPPAPPAGGAFSPPPAPPAGNFSPPPPPPAAPPTFAAPPPPPAAPPGPPPVA